MNTFLLVISSPEGNLYEGQAQSILLRGAEGDLEILSGHIPFMTTVKECNCTVTLDDDTDITGHTKGGILTVSGERTTLLSGSFVWDE